MHANTYMQTLSLSFSHIYYLSIFHTPIMQWNKCNLVLPLLLDTFLYPQNLHIRHCKQNILWSQPADLSVYLPPASLDINFLRFHVNEGSCSCLIDAHAQVCAKNQFPVFCTEHVCSRLSWRSGRCGVRGKKVHYSKRSRDEDNSGERRRIMEARKKGKATGGIYHWESEKDTTKEGMQEKGIIKGENKWLIALH